MAVEKVNGGLTRKRKRKRERKREREKEKERENERASRVEQRWSVRGE